jgi:succinate dehydrogenase / fumarate reductase flavoprotein subunit
MQGVSMAIAESTIGTVIDADVLVVGGSGAALMASSVAASRGAKVVVASKGKIGRSGNAIMIGGGWGIDGRTAREDLGLAGTTATTDPDQLFERILKQSFFLADQDLVRQLVKDSGPAFKIFSSWMEASGYPFAYNPSWAGWGSSGKGMARALASGRTTLDGVAVHEDTVITDLVVEDGRVIGAVGFRVADGSSLFFRAAAVVLATGGYQPYSLKNTISDMTGDGIAAAFRAGAEISGLEFLLSIPTIAAPRDIAGSILPFLMTIKGGPFSELLRVVDENGRELAIPPEFEKLPPAKLWKLVFTYYWGYVAGGKRFFYDFSGLPRGRVEEAFDKAIANYAAAQHASGHYNKIDLEALRNVALGTGRLEVELGNEYSMGGVSVNADLSTSLGGLFAAGEVTDGPFGAFRGGDGITEMVAQGYRAGVSAAESVAKGPRPTGGEEIAKARIAEALSVFSAERSKASSFELRSSIETAADRGFGVVRDDEGLRASLEVVRGIRTRELPALGLTVRSRRYNVEWLNWLETRNMALCLETGLAAAIERKESRGTHLRSDYPRIDQDRFLVKFVARSDGGNIALSTRTPRAAEVRLPTGETTIPEYILGL